MVKYVSNAWHATKIAFANEVGRMARALSLDGRQVMELVAKDAKLNASAAYMRPGFAYGGSCIPKDLRALLHVARTLNVPTHLLEAVPASNALQVSAALDMITDLRPKAAAILGLAFKPGTDDLRESPTVLLVKQLLGEGVAVRVHDARVHEAQLQGTNLDYIRLRIPHFESLIHGDIADVAPWGDILVVTHNTDEYRAAVLEFADSRPVVDLVGLFDTAPPDVDLHGIAW
jgi:GDP-mannose 6-dehydrogenase